MDKDIGKEIQNWAVLLCVIGVVSSIISGIILLINENLFGLAFAFLGPIISFVTYYLMYGFGELVMNSNKILSQSCAILELLNSNDKLVLHNNEESKQEQEIQTEDCDEKIPNE